MDFQHLLPYRWGFGLSERDPLVPDLEEPIALMRTLKKLGVAAINLTCGSPYYNPHLQRPAMFPPSDGYLPPEDPLAGVVRQIQAARQCKEAIPDLPMVGTAYTPELPADTLQGRPMQRKRICRTFSDCTTAPRNAMISGCFPLDPHYKSLPEAEALRAVKKQSGGK
jgi:hypothetical protein